MIGAASPSLGGHGSATQALLALAIDYAGLFPPAALDMDSAVRNYAEYRAGPERWALGRFVVPVSRLGELAELTASLDLPGAPWLVSALAGADPSADAQLVSSFNARQAGRLRVDMIEGKASNAETVQLLARTFAGMEIFVEVVPDAQLEHLVAAIRDAGVGAKLRTGGVTADAFPASVHVARFIRACVDAGIPWKATAGLHHPVRGDFPLTYSPDAPRASMYGYLNVLAATARAIDGGDVPTLVETLESRDAAAVAFDDGKMRWGELQLTEAALVRVRLAMRSFGSCSFREPLDELALLARGPGNR